MRGSQSLAQSALAALLALLLATVLSRAWADHAPDHEPANKVAVAGSDLVVLGPTAGDVTILQETIRTAAPTDLLLQVTLECNIELQENKVLPAEVSLATAQVEVLVTVDGQPVPVAADSPRSSVVFCNRLFRTIVGDADESSLRLTDTFSTHAFNWARLDAGSGLHRIEVRARIREVATVGDFARAFIQSRTLVIEPVKMARGEAVTPVDVTPVDPVEAPSPDSSGQ
jgi:hypothetical protein